MSLSERIIIYDRKLISDGRGWFLKPVTGLEEGIDETPFGEIYLTLGKPGQRKGGHFHPLANEWFCLIEGDGILKLEDISTHEEMSIHMSGMEPKTIFVPNNVAHIFINNGNADMLVLAYTDRKYEPTDTVAWHFD